MVYVDRGSYFRVLSIKSELKLKYYIYNKGFVEEMFGSVLFGGSQSCIIGLKQQHVCLNGRFSEFSHFTESDKSLEHELESV